MKPDPITALRDKKADGAPIVENIKTISEYIDKHLAKEYLAAFTSTSINVEMKRIFNHLRSSYPETIPYSIKVEARHDEVRKAVLIRPKSMFSWIMINGLLPQFWIGIFNGYLEIMDVDASIIDLGGYVIVVQKPHAAIHVLRTVVDSELNDGRSKERQDKIIIER